MKNDSKTSSGGILKKVTSVIKGSVIISALDKFCTLVYRLLGSGMFARIFSGGAADSPAEQKTARRGIFSKTREWISQKIETSHMISKINSLFAGLVSCRLRVIGTYLLTFAVYTGLFSAISLILTSTTAERYESLVLLTEALTVAAVSIPFLISKKTVSGALNESRICNFFIQICGFTKSKLWSDNKGGRYAVAFVLGILSGIMTMVLPTMYIFAGIIAAIFTYIVLSVPEFGVVCMFFLAALIPTKALAALTALVTFAFIVKIIRGKRVFSFEKVDLFVAALGVLLIFGGLVSFSSDSLWPAAMYTCFLVGYFLVSCCIRSEEWLYRCVGAALWSGLIVAFYGILQYVLSTSTAGAWIDSDLFEGIAGRAVSTLENPNMLGEYLIMIIPSAFAMWVTGKSMSRKYSFVSFACLSMCLILTWSRGAWLGFIFAFVAFLLIWHRRSMWLLVGGAFSIPFLPFILPDTIITRFTSIGNLADTSTSYRVSIWRAAVHMIEDYLFTGIGIGEGAWREIYPDYTLPGIEAAPHSHNLFFQITLETGIFGIAFFFIILFLLVKISFTVFAKLSRENHAELEPDFARNRKLAIAGPLCGLLAVLIQGLTDNSWYNYRVYLMLWLTIGLIPAFVKNTRNTLNSATSERPNKESGADEAFVDISLTQKPTDK